ncbi:MAG: hypothetical protein C4B57_00025 [Deltaproteobacteria bacterium]|nr:MAG: hypothetical protein C4B57_00025 [Deltaproteobacteria bacterium]
MAELADVFRRHGVEYLERFGGRVLPSHRHALCSITECRTEALGGHLAQCSHCAHLRYSYHSCRNRSCPKCHRTDTDRWLSRRRRDLLPVTYFHVVFTLPKELGHIVRSHQRILFNVLFLAAARSLMKLAADEKYVGGQIGLLCVLHTWTRAMIWHPHIHCLVPGIGLSKDGQSRFPAGRNYLVPVAALSRIFRASSCPWQERPSLISPSRSPSGRPIGLSIANLPHKALTRSLRILPATSTVSQSRTTVSSPSKMAT